MTFRPALWHPIAMALSGLNLVGVGYAVALAEPWHAAAHAGLGLAFGFWARRLGGRPGVNELESGFDVLEAEVSDLRRELSEAQERLDFTERLLAQDVETRRAARERY